MEGKAQIDDVQPSRHLPHLPDDIIINHILPWLPIKPLTRFKAVFKEWYNSLSSPDFILNYTKKPLFSHPGKPLESIFIQSGNNFYLYSCENDDNVFQFTENNNLVGLDVEFYVDRRDSIYLVGCSNGLVCLKETYDKYFILWNPATNQHQKYMCFQNVYISGFGYVSSLNDYKVVGTIHEEGGEQAKVFSLKSNTWEKIEFGLGILLDRPIFVNQTLYWTALCRSTAKMRIVAFDLALGTLEWLPNLSLNMLTLPSSFCHGRVLIQAFFQLSK